MTSPQHPKVPVALQPGKEEEFAYDLDQALQAVVGVAAHIPPNAFTAETLGLERSGHGAIIRGDGLVLTIGYLIAEADEVWITLASGRVERGHVLSYDQESGFGLVQILAHVDLPSLALGDSARVEPGCPVLVAGAGGRAHCVKASVVSRQEFTGYWEYIIDEAIFTAPSHPYWGGAALLGPRGELLGVGSLQLQQEDEKGAQQRQVNMIVPIDILKPVYEDLVTTGRRRTPPRPWLGLYAADIEGHVVVVGVSSRGPAKSADLRVGDVILGVGGELVSDASRFFRKIWSLGPAGAQAQLLVHRDGRKFDVYVKSADRSRFFAAPKLH
jgi:S1-C subfamily serine protease